MTFSASPRRRTLRATAAIASACAQSFPVKTVEIVPFGSAGGAIDAIARARSWP
jgi:tripartite-type tricarboxylate transporter receptor subunit TctC